MNVQALPDLSEGLAATDVLVSMARAGRFTQSLLLVGPPGGGKRAVAKRFAAALLCSALPADRPCGECRACRLLTRQSHPDLLVAPRPLRVEAVRGLCAQFALSPTEGALRIALIADVDLASPGASNALLKTIEEPPTHGVVVLTASSSAQVLPTLRSRCQIVQVGRRSRQSVEDGLVAAGIAPDRAGRLAGLADGRLGWALDAAADNGFEEAQDRWLDGLVAALYEGTVDRMLRAGAMVQNGDVEDALGAWRTWARDVMAASVGHESALAGANRAAEVKAEALRLGAAGAVALLTSIESALTRMAANANRLLALEALLLELP